MLEEKDIKLGEKYLIQATRSQDEFYHKGEIVGLVLCIKRPELATYNGTLALKWISWKWSSPIETLYWPPSINAILSMWNVLPTTELTEILYAQAKN